MKKGDVTNILPVNDGESLVTEKMGCTHIFQRVHGDVSLPGAQGFKDLFGEEIGAVKRR